MSKIRMRQARVPLALLLAAELTPCAKLVWIMLRLDAQAAHGKAAQGRSISPTALARRIGIARSTVYTAFYQLVHAGWASAARGAPRASSARIEPRIRPLPSAPAHTVSIPLELLTDSALRPQARLLYGLLQAAPGFKQANGHISYAKLSRWVRLNVKTVKRAMAELSHAGWLSLTQANRLAPVHVALRNPIAARAEAELRIVRRRIERAPFRGEALMKEFLSLIVDSDDFQDNAAPGFLVNPITAERMEFDRFYPHRVAFEFNGPQHYGATEHFSEEEATMQRARDLMKLGICTLRGISLVTVHAEDLTLETMRQKVGTLLPQRDLTGWGPVIEYLERASRAYRRAARSRRQSHAAPAASA